MRSARWSVPNAMLAGVLALALCSGGTVFGGGVFSRAWADEAEEAQRAVDDAQATLDDAEALATEFFAGQDVEVLLVINVGHPGPDAYQERNPRLPFEEVYRVL